MSKRKMVDCKLAKNNAAPCTVTIIGSEQEVLREAARHAHQEHEHPITPQLHEQIRSMLKDEK